MQPLARVSKKTADHVPANIEHEALRVLLEILPGFGAQNEKEEENSDVDISDVRGGLLDKWKQHEQYSMGMRLAELSVMWHVNGWSNQKFPCFLAWATKHFPYAFWKISITADDAWIVYCPLSCRPHIRV